MSIQKGPVVKWHYAAFALPRQEFDSPQVHKYKYRSLSGIYIS